MSEALMLDLQASDVTGQQKARISGVSPESTVGELVNRLIDRMRLVRQDAAGRVLAYKARLDRNGGQLHGSDRVGDVLENDDRLVLQPSINAG